MDTIKAITEEVMRQMEMIKELQAEMKVLKQYKQERDSLWAEVGRRLKEMDDPEYVPIDEVASMRAWLAREAEKETV
jgi:hypothetical protein